METKLAALYFTLLISFLLINATQSRTTPPSICSSSCGDISNITYPYRLNTDPAHCGDPDFELTCHNNTTPTLSFNGGSYVVKRINYDQHLIRIADVNLANGSCGLPSKSLSHDDMWLDARYRGMGDNYDFIYTLNYVRCRNNISELANISRVPCLTASNVYVNVTQGRRLYSYDVPSSCDVVSILPATYEGRVDNGSSYDTVLKMQESGFDLRWSVECRDCGRKGRGCVLASRDTNVLFKCEEEYDERRAAYTLIVLVIALPIVGFIMFVVLFVFICKKYCASKKKTDVIAESAQKDQQP